MLGEKEDNVGKGVRDKTRVQGKDMGGQLGKIGKTDRVVMVMAIGTAAPTEARTMVKQLKMKIGS